MLPRLETIRGRLSNSCVISGRRVFLSQIEEAAFQDDAVADLECTVTADGCLALLIRTVPGETIDKEALLDRLMGAVLPAGTGVAVEEESVCAFSPERSPKKRMNVSGEN